MERQICPGEGRIVGGLETHRSITQDVPVAPRLPSHPGANIMLKAWTQHPSCSCMAARPLPFPTASCKAALCAPITVDHMLQRGRLSESPFLHTSWLPPFPGVNVCVWVYLGKQFMNPAVSFICQHFLQVTMKNCLGGSSFKNPDLDLSLSLSLSSALLPPSLPVYTHHYDTGLWEHVEYLCLWEPHQLYWT